MLVEAQPRLTMLNVVRGAENVAEIGVFKADFSVEILRIVQPKKLYLIDPWENSDDPAHEGSWYAQGSHNNMATIEQHVRKRLEKQMAAGVVEMQKGYSAEVMAVHAPDSFDFIYIDGDHSYEGVKADLEICCSRVKVGGYIGLDDYSIGKWWGDGVVRATHEILAKVGADFKIVFAMQNQVLLRRLV